MASRRPAGERPVLRSISPEATPEEVAAIVAAITELTRPTAQQTRDDDTSCEWVRASRYRARRAGMQRGPWRLSGRLGRRVRA